MPVAASSFISAQRSKHGVPPDQVIVVDDWLVHPNWRGMGLGAGLLAHFYQDLARQLTADGPALVWAQLPYCEKGNKHGTLYLLGGRPTGITISDFLRGAECEEEYWYGIVKNQ
jgi:hypothetical protein